MKRITFLKNCCLSLAMALISTVGFSQPPSPAATATGTVKGANISIKYSSPSVKGRQIWGGLVPYDKVWRAGANSATILETDKDIKVEGKALPAGKYSVYAIPGEKEWTIILNSQTGQWGINRDGSTTEDPAKDVLRVTVKSKKSASLNERLVYTINDKGFVLSWENLDIPVSIK
ncbi:MAG: DUF2911 domain-containing protein [Bacteroidota bacterium]